MECNEALWGKDAVAYLKGPMYSGCQYKGNTQQCSEDKWQTVWSTFFFLYSSEYAALVQKEQHKCEAAGRLQSVFRDSQRVCTEHNKFA
jgi:hypothetical protein